MLATGPPAPDEETAGRGPALVRSLGAWDGALITIGATVGSGIFLTTGDIARRLPQPGLILLLWVAGGLYAMAGALAYSELGTMFPRAGGQYHFLKEAYGRLWGFLFGWTSFLVIMTGGIAAIAVGFGEYLGAFLPVFSGSSELLSLRLGELHWAVNGPQLAGALAIVLLTLVNWLGVREGALVQNVATALKVGALALLAAIGLGGPAASAPSWWMPVPEGSLVRGLGLGMVAVLWTYDGWYVLTFSAGEMKRPERTSAARAAVGSGGGGHALPGHQLGLRPGARPCRPRRRHRGWQRPRPLRSAARAPHARSRWSSCSRCSAASRPTCSAAPASTSPWQRTECSSGRWPGSTPGTARPPTSLLAQGGLAAVLALSGNYAELYTTVVFAGVLFHAATAAAVFVLRRTRPDAPRPYRAWGHPWVTGAFVPPASSWPR